ncbi:Glutathione-regulated potassium-efflux system ancillary protein KefF [Dickeya dianthicola]|uniref:Flavodoxin family protein n=2 Tax=Dickeya dianthicola TaxID=204039 RepID=A0AAP2CY90_9GAMM|nr:NAD(P)H-dependent oxidoreductase [Dickeya dianthicola]ATO32328.1 NAD(P)H oxidoreductase YRKL, Putative NADPH-quinone reductase (modulator of drug activity B), Flavodoxin 2 [Dickeya dianthicola RNS04.9]AYC18318.1 Glutathione-regulated potassium-efflux system ancillary protein KefF [Dickeya dianthicola]MBI0439892.1 NAD(P)H-dependent oxidoreductase [Dickeya dianthicola]MBI0450617.1 NAD(P)H-dependent oxidoreductase [Dickeya dianthicola]MBI0455206.1 NAD(P)H-dependent oxidoreductase [Dickeya dian
MKEVLIVSGHPNMDEESFSNRIILECLTHLLPEANTLRLDRAHHHYEFDIGLEQERLKKADIIVFQFPMFWYGLPALMKKYIDDVFAHGFAYGSTGTYLKDKTLLVSFTTGGAEADYRYDGEQRYPVEDFLPFLKNLAWYCGMHWGGMVYSGGLMFLPGQDESIIQEMKRKAEDHARTLADNVMRLNLSA